ncbi:MAG: aminomethyl transferase family protein [bacterium]|nr:aminomethyl transferase family protein [bacterium]
MKSSPLLALHEATGGRFAPPGPASATLLTFGDVPAEYAAGMEGALAFDRCERGALELSGTDAEAFLHRITSNAVKGLGVGQGCRNLLLTPKGKVQRDFDLARTETGFRLSTPPGEAEALATDLGMFIFTEDIAIADVSEEHAPIEVCGPRAGAILEATFGVAPPQDDHVSIHVPFAGQHDVLLTRLPVAGSHGWRIDGGAQLAPGLWTALTDAGARAAGLVAWDCLRVEAGSAAWGRDVDDGIYPQEARLERAFSLEKGCYIGQEVVAKIDTYGGLNKCLFALAVDHDDPVRAGTRLMREDGDQWRDLGVVTSWAYSFVLDTGLVLGYVKRKHQESGTVFRLGEGPGTAKIVALPVREGTVPVTGPGTDEA